MVKYPLILKYMHMDFEKSCFLMLQRQKGNWTQCQAEQNSQALEPGWPQINSSNLTLIQNRLEMNHQDCKWTLKHRSPLNTQHFYYLSSHTRGKQNLWQKVHTPAFKTWGLIIRCLNMAEGMVWDFQSWVTQKFLLVLDKHSCFSRGQWFNSSTHSAAHNHL